MSARDPRFFLAPGHCPLAPGAEIVLDPPTGRQIARVLRLRRGDRILLHDGRGGAWESVLAEVAGHSVVARVEGKGDCAPEPPIAIALHAAVLKGERQDWLIQKAVELGAAFIQPLLCSRGVVKPGADRVDRWRRIAREAAEQSERGIVPPVHSPVAVGEVIWNGPAIVCTERSGRPLRDLAPAEGPLALFIGPEGGWEPEEIAELREKGAQAASLGRRILRAETAALAALAGLQVLADR